MKLGTLSCCVLILAGTIACHAPLRADAPENVVESKTTANTGAVTSSAVEGFKLSVKTEKTTYIGGEAITLSVTIRNASDKLLHILKPHPFGAYKVSVFLPNKQLAPLTLFGKQEFEHVPRFKIPYVGIKPGEEQWASFPISRLFDMSLNGKYQIVVTRIIQKQDGTRSDTPITSDAIDVEVTG